MAKVAYIEVEVREDVTAEDVRETVKELLVDPSFPGVIAIRSVSVNTRV